MSTINYQGNPKYRDRLFRMLFNDRDNIASLCSALGEEEYTANDIEDITTIDDVIYIKMKNDISFLLDSYLFLWEQQSTVNPNMPLRGLMYFGELYSAYVTNRGLNIYGTKLVNIPTPRYIVFYNGLEDTSSVVRYRLSDAFINKDTTGEFQWTATMYNLNKGKNDSILDKCRPLKEYMALVENIRYFQSQDIDSIKAVDMAVDRSIKQGILVDFLTKHRAEVRNMILTEFNEEIYEKGIRQEGREEGRVDERERSISSVMESLSCSRDEAMRILKITDFE